MNIVGITSCTCGIAHTYMAREKLLETGEKFGWSVKIETQGSGGVEFALTDEDINAADCVLIASDVAVSGTRKIQKENQWLKYLLQQQSNHQNIFFVRLKKN